VRCAYAGDGGAITHEIGLEEVNRGFELLETPDARAVKVMVKLGG